MTRSCGKIFFLFSTILFFSFLPAGKNKPYIFLQGSELLIELKDSAVFLNGGEFRVLDFDRVQKVIGKPDKVHKYLHNETMRRWSYDKEGGKTPCQFSEVKLTDYYYMYNKLGVMLYTHNSFKRESQVPTKLLIFTGSKREFDNTARHPWFPEKSFSGNLMVHAEKINPDQNPIPESVNYNSDKFSWHGIICGPTSIATKIDRIYSMEYSPPFTIYLNSKEEQKVSYIEFF